MLFINHLVLIFTTEIKMKQCRLCLEFKSQDQFGKRIKSLDGLRHECRACRKIESKEAYAKDPEKNKQGARAWVLANKEKRQLYVKEWTKANMGKCVAALSRYRKKNPEKFRAYKSTRRARELGAVCNFSGEDVKLLMKEQNGQCKYCGKILSKYHLDHRMPLALGGITDKKNMQLLCPSCNSRKGAKHPERFENEISYTDLAVSQ